MKTHFRAHCTACRNGGKRTVGHSHGKAGSLPNWKLEPTTCSAILAGHDDRWVDTPATRAPMAPTERCKDDEDPFGQGDALDAEEESGSSTRRPRNEHESLEEHHVSKLVLGNGVVHHSHETWSLRGITFCGKCGA